MRKPKLNMKGMNGSHHGSQTHHDSMGNGFDKNKIVYFVPSQRSQQVQIGLKAIGLTHEQIRMAIMKLNDTVLIFEKLTKLREIIPTSEEQLHAERESQSKSVKYFGVVEKFFYSLFDMVELNLRIKAWVFKNEFKYRLEHLTKQVTMIDKAISVIKTNRNFKLLLGLILQFGNHMNDGTRKGSQYGFQLNVISLLPNIKTLDNLSFLMYIYDFLQKKYPHVLNVLDEFSILGNVATVSSELVNKEYDALVNDVNELKQMIDRYVDVCMLDINKYNICCVFIVGGMMNMYVIVCILY